MRFGFFIFAAAVAAAAAATFEHAFEPQEIARLHPRMVNLELAPRRATMKTLEAKEFPAAIAKIADKVLSSLNATGMGVAVVHNHEIVFAGGFGLADRATRTPVTGNTLFQIASNSKAFTSMLAIMAEEKGLLPLDVPVSELVAQMGGSVRFAMNDTAATAVVTLRDMMSHRTGLPRHDQISFNIQQRMQLLEKLPYLQLDKPTRYQPGEYNNIMFGLTGIAEELVMGEQWETLVQKHIFEPLGMNMSFGNLSSARASEFAKNLATPYTVNQEQVAPADADMIAPAGAVVSCANDMAKWIQLHLRQSAQIAKPGSPPPAGPLLVSPAMYTNILGSNSLFPGMYSSFSEYSMGWWRIPMYEDVNTGKFETMVSHPGDLDGMASSAAFFPALGHGLVVLTNAGGSSARDAMTLELADLLLGVADPTPSWLDVLTQAQIANNARLAQLYNTIQFLVKHSPPPSLPLTAYTGVFTTYKDVYGTAEITLDEQVQPPALRVCGDNFLYGNFSNPLVPICGFVVPAWNNTFALIADPHDKTLIGLENMYIQFEVDTLHGDVPRFYAPLEPKVKPIVFEKL